MTFDAANYQHEKMLPLFSYLGKIMGPNKVHCYIMIYF